MTTTANPLVASRVDMTTPLSGTFLLEDCETISAGIRDGDWLEGGMGAFGAVADGVAMAVDPLGSVLAMGFGWLIDHMWPIKDWFSDLTGDAGEVAAFAATWDNIARQMQGVSDELLRTLADLDDQHGQFFDTYRKFQGENAAHAAAAGRLASAMGVGMQIASTIVKIVHDMTRDALTQLAGTAISAATTAAITIGFGTPWAVAQVTTRVSALSARVGKYITKLVKAIKELLPRLEDAARLFRSLRKALDEALDEALESGKGALRTVVRKSDDVAAALPTPSPAIRAPHAPARSAEDTFNDLVIQNRAHVPGTVPTYRGDVDTVVSFFDEEIADLVLRSPSPTLGPPGSATFLMPSQDADLISSVEDAVIATGAAPRVEQAWRNGEAIYGLEVPAAGLDLRVPTRADAGNYDQFLEGGFTATAEDGLFRINRTRELTLPGGQVMPPGSALFRLLPDGTRLRLAVFG